VKEVYNTESRKSVFRVRKIAAKKNDRNCMFSPVNFQTKFELSFLSQTRVPQKVQAESFRLH
jgi:hypothetical protein